MPEMVQINLRAGEEQKTRWEDYVEDSGRFASLSELIRASVEVEIKSSDESQSESTPALTNDIDRLQEELTTVRKNVAWLREHFQSDVDIADLAQTLFEELEPLPEVEEPIQVPNSVEMDPETYAQKLRAQAVIDSDESADRAPQTASAFAERLDTSPARIDDAIEYLDEQFLPVATVDYDGERHYFREE